MAIREYIGARYVPRFLGTYDATTIYEALDVVDNGLGTSFIAKIPTPAGTPLTNTTYWAIYGATSGAIIHLQNQIDDINTTIDSFNPIAINKYGNTFADYQMAAGEADFMHPLVLTGDITLEESESIEIENALFDGCGYTIHLKPHDVSQDVGTSVAYQGIDTKGNCVVRNVNFESQSLYQSYQSKNNGGGVDKCSNRYGIRVLYGNIKIDNCDATHCGMVYIVQTDGYAEISECTSNYSEMFVLGGAVLFMRDCDIKESNETESPYFHVFYTPNAKRVNIENCRFESIGTGAYLQDVFHFYSGSHIGDSDALLNISNCHISNKIANLIQDDYGIVKIDGVYAECDFFVSGSFAPNAIYISNSELLQNSGVTWTQTSFSSLNGVKISNSHITSHSRFGFTDASIDSCIIDGSVLMPAQTGSAEFYDTVFKMDNITTSALNTGTTKNNYHNCTFEYSTDHTDANYFFPDLTAGVQVYDNCFVIGYDGLMLRTPYRTNVTAEIYHRLNADTQFNKIEVYGT